MSKKPNTKRALVLSVLCMVLCASMLIGSTFAWFTDTATTGVNSIQSGTIDLLLKDPFTGEDLEGKSLKWVVNGTATDEPVLWEPGMTVYTQPIRVLNNSTLSFYMDAVITGISGNEKLRDAIEFKIVHAYACLPASQGGKGLSFEDMVGRSYVYAGTGTAFTGEGKNGDKIVAESDGLQADWTTRLNDYNNDGTMVPGPGVNQPKPLYDLCIVGHMKEDAGNEYQGLKLPGIGLTFRATQAPQEYDSYNNTYDADAKFPVVSQDQLDDALNDPNVSDVLIGGGVYNDTVHLTKDVVSDGGTFDTSAKQYTIALDIEKGADVVLNQGTYANAGGAVQIIDAQESGGKLTINGGEYRGGAAVWVREKSDVTINGGNFNTWALVITDASSNNPVIVNGGNFTLGSGGIDAHTGADVIINGGTFNVDPTNWVGQGHTVTQSGNTWTVK